MKLFFNKIKMNLIGSLAELTNCNLLTELYVKEIYSYTDMVVAQKGQGK